MKNTELPAVLAIDQNDHLTLNQQFTNTLKQIENTVEHASKLVTVQTADLGNMDEEQLMATISDLQEAQNLSRNVNDVRRDLKRYLNNRRDDVLAQFDQILTQAKFDQLENYNAQAKQLKKDLSNYRINQRWEKLKPTFDLNLKNYPLIDQLAPDLANFETFRLRHPKLVNGSKSFTLGDKQMSVINNELYMINECLIDLRDNPTNLQPQYQNAILRVFISNPNRTDYLDLKNQYLTRQVAEQKAAQQAQKAKLPPEKPKQAPDQSVSDNDFTLKTKQARKWLADYVGANIRKYGNLHQSAQQKMTLIWNLEHMLDNNTSVLYEFLFQEKDPEKRSQLMLTIIKQIILV